MCAKTRKIVTHFHHSSQEACTAFKNIQIENRSKQPLLLVQDVKTRWNSTFLMLQLLRNLKSTVRLYAGDNEIPIPTANEWQLMEKVLLLLQPFFEITKKVSSEQSILSAVIPDVAALDRYLTKYSTKDAGVHTLKEELRQELRRRFFLITSMTLTLLQANHTQLALFLIQGLKESSCQLNPSETDGSCYWKT